MTDISLGSLLLDVLVGVGVLLVGIGVLVGMLALAKTLRRLDQTLEEVDRQLAGIGRPLTATLAHVDGIADSAGQAVARLGVAAQSLEAAAGSVSQTATLARDAISPGIVNLGATVAGVTAGLRRLVTGKMSGD